MTRKPIGAGSFYPSDRQELSSMLEGFFSNTQLKLEDRKINALIVPHAGYVYSGGVAAHAYKLLTPQSFTQVVIIAPSHRYPFRGASIDRQDCRLQVPNNHI